MLKCKGASIRTWAGEDADASVDNDGDIPRQRGEDETDQPRQKLLAALKMKVPAHEDRAAQELAFHHNTREAGLVPLAPDGPQAPGGVVNHIPLPRERVRAVQDIELELVDSVRRDEDESPKDDLVNIQNGAIRRKAHRNRAARMQATRQTATHLLGHVEALVKVSEHAIQRSLRADL